MGNGRQPVIFLVGPSGAGKSTLAGWLAEDDGFLHLEIDEFPNGDGIDAAGLRAEWEAFRLGGSARPLAEAISRQAAAVRHFGAVLSFPSLLVLDTRQLETLRQQGVTALVLYGAASECLDSFLRYEERTSRVQGVDPVEHWMGNNRASYMAFSRPEYAAIRLNAFQNGTHVPRAALVAEVRRRRAC